MSIKMYIEGGLEGISEDAKELRTPIFKSSVDMSPSDPIYAFMIRSFEVRRLKCLFDRFCSDICCEKFDVTSNGLLDYSFVRLNQSDETSMEKEARDLATALGSFGVSLAAYVLSSKYGCNIADDFEYSVSYVVDYVSAAFGEAIFKQKYGNVIDKVDESVEYVLDFVDLSDDFVDDVHRVLDLVANLNRSLQEALRNRKEVNDEFDARKCYVSSRYYTRIRVYEA